MKRSFVVSSALLFLSFSLISDSVFYDFSSQTEYWTFSGGWQLRNNGVNGSVAAWGFQLVEDDFLASPPIFLTAGSTYELSFRLDGGGSNRTIGAAVHTEPALGADTLLSVTILSTEDFANLYTVNFTPETTGAHHLVFFANGGTGSIKLIVDNITVGGAELNESPLCRLLYEEGASTVLAEGARFPFKADALDNDGDVVNVAFEVDGATVNTVQETPYTGVWAATGQGMHLLTATATDNEGGQYTSAPISVDVRPNPWNSSFLGGSGNDAVWGCALQADGTVVLAANLSELPAGITPVYLAGAEPGMTGAILRFSADGRNLLSVTVVGDLVADLARDAQDRLYVAAGSAGLLRLSADANELDYARPLPENAHRVAAGPSGYVVALSDGEEDYESPKLLDARVLLFDPAGNEVLNTRGATTFTTDVAIDEVTRTVYSTGYKNFNTSDGVSPSLPVDVPAIAGTAFDGTNRFNGYNWSRDASSDRWLNLPENNMADTRGHRITVGQDGLLYVAYEADGGNHCLRYSPFSVTEPVGIVGGDAFSEFFNTGTEPKLFVGRYDPLTGQYLRGQQFCARLTNGKANTVRVRGGDIAANAAGEVYVVGASAWGIPINLEYLPEKYRGGAFLLQLSQDFTERQIVTRVSTTRARTIALGPNDGLVFAGETTGELFTNNAYQSTLSGAVDGWFAVEPASSVTLPVRWASFTVEASGKSAARLDWLTAAEVNNRGYYVERSSGRTSWQTVSDLIVPNPERTYSFTDHGLLAGTYRYRIRQVDLDGATGYSEVRQVIFTGDPTWTVVPNPVNDRIEVSGLTGPWRLFDANGRVLRQGSAAGRTAIDVSDLASGLYYLQGEAQVTKVVKR